MGMTGICRAGAAALALFAAVCSSAADSVYLRWTADTNALKRVSCASVRILAVKGERYLDLVCDSGSPATNALPVARVIDAIAAGAVLQAVIGERPPIVKSESYALVLTDASESPVATAEPVTYEKLPESAISVQTEFGLVTPARVDWNAGSPRPLECGFLVNGEDIASGSGTGWTYDGSVLSLTTAMTYVLSGAATNSEVQVHAAVGGATAVLSNAVVFASGRPAAVLEPGATLTAAANQVMMTGDRPDKLAYAASYKGESCVLATTGVTVTVKSGIPHVTGVTVSNAVQQIDGTPVEDGTAYRVLPGDDVYVYYVVEKDCTSQSPNPLEFEKIKAGVTVDANTIRILKNIPYRAWNEATRQMEDKVCTSYTVVTNATTTFENGQWYVVTNAVSTSNLTVNGSAHLILRDGAKLTATGGENVAGVKVESGNALTIYGQALGTGELVATCGRKGAGIGSGINADCGIVTINGGTVTAKGGWDGAGIGSGEYWTGTTQGNSEITINGGRVKAVGDGCGAGIGGGWGHRGGALVINGGTVEAVAGWNGGFSLGDSAGEGNLMRVMINGGSVKADKIKTQPTNSANAAVWCVTAKVERLNVERLNVEGLGDYGTNDIFAIDERVYLWLPDGAHRFSISDGVTTNRYLAVVNGGDVAAERLGPLGFFANGTDVGDVGIGDGWVYFGRVLSLTNAISYVLSGAATNNEVQVHAAVGGATAVLSNAVVFASERPAVVVTPGATLTVAANQVMRAGGTPEAMRYTETCGDALCVLAGPAVTVTVKDIPHVKDVVVSNRTETISKAAVEGGTAYRVMKGDDIFVGYTVDEGYTSQVPNPLVYPAVESDVTVDANTIRVLPHIPYRAWNAEKHQMEDRVCTAYEIVTNATATKDFADGRWYVVTGTVECSRIWVKGSAHLILCDNASLTARGYGNITPGVEVRDRWESSLHIYGQTGGTGSLVAIGSGNASGIGGGDGGGPAGTVTIDGGTVTATGGSRGAGIGGGNGDPGGTVVINGGTVTATGGAGGAGIGGGQLWDGQDGAGGTVVINGGTVTATGGAGAVDIGRGSGGSSDGSLTIDGGSVNANPPKDLAKNSTPTNVYCVTAKVEKLKVEKLKVEGLEGYGTNDIYAVEGKVYLWLPDGAHRFSISDGTTTNRYLAVVNGGDVVAERLGPIGFFANGTDVGDAGVGDGWVYFGRVLSLTDAKACVLSGAATNNEVQVHAAVGGVTAVLSNAVVFASGRPAVVVTPGATLTVAANQVMRAGGTPEAMRYTETCGDALCVLAGPAVTVTVKDIPHVKDVVVSNRTETISKATAEGGTAYRVMKGDDIFVGYTVDEGYTSQVPNPLVYAAVESDVTVDANTIRILPSIPYRAWNGSQMEDRVCTDYTVVTNAMTTFEDGTWYVVTGKVSTIDLKVDGAAHLILCDGARMTANGVGNHAGIQVAQGCVLAICGQTFGTGELIAQGGWHSAGIGAVERSETAEGCGAVVIHGGTVTANGGGNGAGIGGGFECAGGTVTVYGGRVCANGGNYAAGIGGGSRGAGGVVTINGGTVRATHSYTAMDIGGGATGNMTVAPGGTVTINGGSVKAGTIDNVPSNGVGRVYCVTVKCPDLEGLVSLEGLAGYGTNDIYAVDNRVYLWLPKGTHWFTVSDGTTTHRYCATVKGRAITVEPLGPVGFFVNGKDIGDTGSGTGWTYQEKILTLGSSMSYVLSGVATNDEVQVKVATGGATVVLSNAVVFTSGRPALDVAQNAALQMAGGASFLGTAKNFAAVAVASNAKLAVDLAPDANRNEAMIGVFNSGSAAAIEGAGSAVVKGGTFFVWSDNTAVGLPEFTCDPDEIMQAGDTPEEMWYTMTDWRSKPCVLVGPAVTVTVLKDIPHVSGFTVSNDVQAIQGIPVPPGATYRVMLGDDLFVGYTVEEGYTSQAANPLVYVDVEKDFTVDANTIRILKNIPYRAWNETKRQMEDKECTNYTVVVEGTQAFADGQWYAVTGAVERGAITVSGAAHLILCDGAKLSAEGDEYASEAGVEVLNGHSLAIYGQSGGTGRLVATGGSRSAGIGGTGAGGDKGVCGTVTINGGIVTATGGEEGGAGIGGGGLGAGGIVTINGGTVTARGGEHAAGIGGGFYGAGGTVTINGGTVTATGSGWGAGIGSGRDRFGGTVTINGGTVNANGGSYGGAGIGSGYGGTDAVITINGGTVTARDDGPGAGIGDGCDAGGSTVTINDGMVTATSTGGGAGIGGGAGSKGGTVAINGGTVTATGAGFAGAGIGGGNRGNGGVVTINGGAVMARGSEYGAGIGSSDGGEGGIVTVNGGTVMAEGGVKAMDIGRGGASSTDGSLTIDGGSVKAMRVAKDLAKNSTPTNVYRVTVKVEGLKVEKLKVEGLENYGTNDIYAVDNRVYLWLPKGTHRFSISDGTTTYNYCAVMKGVAITVEPLGPVGFFVNGKDIGDTGSGEGWDYSDRNLTLSEAGQYVLSGAATNDEVQVKVATGGATVVLSNAVVFTSGRPALNIAQSAALQMAGGASYLAATNNAMAVSVGPNAVLAVGLAPGANEAEAMIGVFNYGILPAIVGAGSVAVGGGTLAVWADRRASEVPLTRAADVFCMVAGSDPETAKVVDAYNGEAYVLVTASVAPVTPGTPFGSFTTAEAATNAMKKAVLAPRDDVEAALGSGAARQTYCDMFGFAVTGGDTDWFVEAVLHPEAWTNVVLSAQAATRQIPVAAIATLPLNTPTNVTVKACCVPGFYYSVYAGSTVTNLGAVAAEKGRNVLCGPDRDVEFSGVVKPSAAAGFFTIGVKEAPSVNPSDWPTVKLEPSTIIGVQE